MVGQGCLRDADVESFAAPLLSLLNRVAPACMTTREQVGRAMIHVARNFYPKPVQEIEDINRP